MEKQWVNRTSYTVPTAGENGHNHSGKQFGSLVRLNFITVIPFTGLSHTEILSAYEPGDTSWNVHTAIP